MINDMLNNPTDGKTKTMMNLSGWICHNYKYKSPLTHLKLQKLFFYCYGALLAANLEDQVGEEIIFEPWEHGPVNNELYKFFRSKGSEPIEKKDFPEAGVYSKKVVNTLTDALTVYGVMSAWSLRNQTHAEEPWKTAYGKKEDKIDPENLKRFFKIKFSSGSVAAPEYLFSPSSFKIDGIPVQNYPDLNSLAKAVNSVFSDFKSE